MTMKGEWALAKIIRGQKVGVECPDRPENYTERKKRKERARIYESHFIARRGQSKRSKRAEKL